MSDARRRAPAEAPHLAPLEAEVMRVLWQRGECTAEEIGRRLPRRSKLSDSSIRTLLRRLEAKDVVAHELDGRRFVYRPLVSERRLAAAAARRIVDSICGGVTESLVLGLLEDEAITLEEIDALRERIEAADGNE